MPAEVVYYYAIGTNPEDGVCVLSYVHNVFSAKKAMLAKFGKTERDIKTFSKYKPGTERKDCHFFDGRNA